MTLPRFTSGQVGKLTFFHLNEAFDRIETISADPGKPFNQILGRVILAKITAHQGSGSSRVGSFVEVSANAIPPTSYTTVSGGVNSNGFVAPIVAPVSAVNSIVPILGHVAADGKLYFRECSAPAAVRLGRISTSAQIGTSSRWIYTLTGVAIDNVNQGTYIADGTGSFQALNGCENPLDVSASRQIGVGTIYPSTLTTTPVRKAIKNETVVLCVASGTDYVFSIPNGYEFTC